MKRDVFEIASKAKIDRHYELSAFDMARILCMDDRGEAIAIAFRYGYVMGGRASRNGKYQERRNG